MYRILNENSEVRERRNQLRQWSRNLSSDVVVDDDRPPIGQLSVRQEFVVGHDRGIGRCLGCRQGSRVATLAQVRAFRMPEPAEPPRFRC